MVLSHDEKEKIVHCIQSKIEQLEDGIADENEHADYKLELKDRVLELRALERKINSMDY